MSSDPLRMFRGGFSVDVTTAGVQATGLAPQPVSFGSIDTGSAPPPVPRPMPMPPGASPPSAPVPMPSSSTSAPVQPPAGMWDMAASFAGSMTKFASGGFKTVSDQVHKERMALCNACPHHTGTRCVACGCFTHAKAWMPHEACPIQKWVAVKT